MNIAIGVLTFLLVLVCLFLILVVLAQKAKSDGGVGAAMGGGMAEAAFGADTGNVLSRSTIYAAVAFFALSFVLFLAHIRRATGGGASGVLPTIQGSAPAMPGTMDPLMPGMPMTPAPAAPATGTGLTVPAAGTPAVPVTEAPKAP